MHRLHPAVTAILGCPFKAAILIGTVAAYPLHTAIREHYALVPAAWIHGRERAMHQALQTIVHDLYHPDSLETADFCLDPTTTIAAITNRMAAARNAPWVYTGFTASHQTPYFNHFLITTCDMGRIARGVYGTVHHRIDSAPPPFVITGSTPVDPSLASRFLFFSPHPAADIELPQADITSGIMESLITREPWEKLAMLSINTFERELASNLNIPLRLRIQLAIAAGVFSASSNLSEYDGLNYISLIDFLQSHHASFYAA